MERAKRFYRITNPNTGEVAEIDKSEYGLRVIKRVFRRWLVDQIHIPDVLDLIAEERERVNRPYTHSVVIETLNWKFRIKGAK